MNQLSRTGLLVLLGFAVVSLAMPGHAAQPRVIHINASRFKFQPEKIVLKKGEPVVLEVQSLDRLHGFNIPALGIRADAQPAQPIRINLTPQKTGRLTFFCDIFCGSGHEEMAGEMVVE